MIERPSPNFDDRGEAPTILMIHYTGMTSAAAALDRLCDPAAKVSCHYLIDEDGTPYRLVAEDRRAWHAGAGSWRGQGNVNARSIGIELVNPGHDWGYRPFPPAQMAALKALGRAIVERHRIDPFDVIGHSDSAPGRKIDPGELFDWADLAGAGIGFWTAAAVAPPGPALGPGDEGPAVRDLQAALAAFGYGLAVDGVFGAETGAVVAAFQRHWRQDKVDGIADAGTRARLDQLLRYLPLAGRVANR
ncbi:peptidoglycan recognition protein family protein [Zavarzinia compransoris]|uniref:N-acetylmuramoyl-L-alanine amidase n=1 Tax=Zavarzinia compransoris TaxID=1264899 RepID=A0A317DTM1_9PROT|nr:N-acetylmuramoyl-L-alanine amidase [Zavarzinia compransoris]PWR18038.1 N-acetylmuramoyl-L-alanine amidase [Zavarzinia compransoris]TDP43495.1 N-acetylmuramoyl-L-alanine amidase [Zavarzinia compransoris]